MRALIALVLEEDHRQGCAQELAQGAALRRGGGLLPRLFRGEPAREVVILLEKGNGETPVCDYAKQVWRVGGITALPLRSAGDAARRLLVLHAIKQRADLEQAAHEGRRKNPRADDEKELLSTPVGDIPSTSEEISAKLLAARLPRAPERVRAFVGNARPARPVGHLGRSHLVPLGGRVVI